MVSATICEAPSLCLVRDCTYLAFRLRYPQYCKKGVHRFPSILRLRLSDCDQYYALATTVIFFYDFLLTLADEVSHTVGASLHHTHRPSRERSNTLGRGVNHGVRREDQFSYGIH